MLKIHKNAELGLLGYFVIDSQDHFERLEFPDSEKDWRQGWERLHEGYGEFIRLHPSYAFPRDPKNVFANWDEFPELHNKPVFACHRKDCFGNNFSDIRREMGV